MHTVHPTTLGGISFRGSQNLPPWNIALIANLKNVFSHTLDGPPDAGAEFDLYSTIESIAAALEADGHHVYFIPGDHALPEALNYLRPDICFNIAEGISGDGREAQVPALCELLRIPYTASRVVANAISLDKSQTKRIWQQVGLPTADFLECSSVQDALSAHFPFPLFVKPAREGSGMGINEGATVNNQNELAARVAWILGTYQQPALVETYLPGREFTVGFIGNPSDHTKPPSRYRPELYDVEGYHWFPVLEIDAQHAVSGIYGYAAKSLDLHETGAPAYLCPADISPDLRERLIALAKHAAQALNVCDVARVDFRLDAAGEPRLLEINTLPGLNPALSDLCIMAAADGLPYQTLITEILYLAAERFAIPFGQAAALQGASQISLSSRP